MKVVVESKEEEEEAGVVGLKILTTGDHHKMMINHQFHSNYPIFQRNNNINIHQINNSSSSTPTPYSFCSSFLKSCFLCHKHLSSNKDVYMYRGDQGFCSQECRSRQIYIDDLTQLEKRSAKKMMMITSPSLHAARCRHHKQLTA